MAFWLLYGLWFGLGVGFVELAKLQWAATNIEPEPQEQRIIAVPPKPRGQNNRKQKAMVRALPIQ